MNRLALAFGIVCLLQGLSAAPRPEYGLSVTVKNSAKITAVADAIGDIQADIVGISFATLSAGYLPYDSTLSVIEDLVDDISSIITPILDGYDTLLADPSGDVASAFSPFIDAIDTANDYLTGSTISGYIATLSANGYYGIIDQLVDEGERLAAGLTALKSAAQAVESALIAAVGAAQGANVPSYILDTYLSLSDMYALLTAANNLKAYLPLLGYILDTVNDNLAEGDEYMTTLQSDIDSSISTTTTAYATELLEIIEDIEDTVSDEFSDIYGEYTAIAASFAGMSGLSGATDYSSLSATISGFVYAFNPLSTIGPLDDDLASAFDDLLSGLSSYIEDTITGVTVVSDSLVNLLVDELVGNLEYGEYCYNKYKYLVDNLLTEGFNAGFECVDKEYLRLQHLKSTLLLILDLLEVDYYDIDGQLSVCNSLTDNSNALNGCVTELSGYYSDLLSATEDKRDLLYQLAEGEATASLNRLLICFELVYIDVSETQSEELYDGLETCAALGPTGSD